MRVGVKVWRLLLAVQIAVDCCVAGPSRKWWPIVWMRSGRMWRRQQHRGNLLLGLLLVLMLHVLLGRADLLLGVDVGWMQVQLVLMRWLLWLMRIVHVLWQHGGMWRRKRGMVNGVLDIGRRLAQLEGGRSLGTGAAD